ncbi:branched-chain-amino-acid transaminase [Risungbinella massiliensis]|uniref:branched-chain-amino-acid transaminase n=1 Tax=Risungbinella massiliensis TaxID=1329796 RepID=UPI0005CC647C|nr:branched-chain-amino-acid transaminase [Risungbinella massiliensis]
MTTEPIIFLNGKFLPKSQALVSVYDHGYLYGDGIFEGIRAYNGNVFRLKEHIVRLYESAKSILLTIPYTMEEMEEYVCETIRQNNLRDCYIRLVVSRGDGPMGIDPFECPQSNVVIIVEQIKMFPQEMYDNGMPIVTVPTRRNKTDALNPKIKSLNYLNNVLIRIEARRAGVHEALTLNSEGYVAEGSGDNVFVVKKGVLYTPPGYLGILEGITRQAILDIAAKLGIPVQEIPFTRHDVYVADEVFLTGTAAEVIAVTEVDGRVIGEGKPGEMTNLLVEEFRKLVELDGTKVYTAESEIAG